jgi:hypothetical protein
VEFIGALKDRYGNWYLFVKHHGRPKRRTQVDDKSRKNVTASRKPFTQYAIPALSKVRVLKGINKTTGNDIRGQSRRNDLRRRKKKTLYDVHGQTLELEVVERTVQISIRLRRLSDWLLWTGQLLSKQKSNP